MNSVHDVSALAVPFWDAARERRLVRPVCAGCRRSFFSPQELCPWCQSSDWTYETSSGLGTVYSFTVVHRPPSPEFTAPYVVADVEMDEGWRLFSWITGCASVDVTIGLRVSVTFAEHPTTGMAPVFTPLDPIRGDQPCT